MTARLPVALGVAMLLSTGSAQARPWSVDIRQESDSAAGGSLACTDLGCTGRMTLVLAGTSSPVEVRAFLDIAGGAVEISFTDVASQPRPIQFDRSRPLRIELSRGAASLRTTLTDPLPPEPGGNVHDLVRRLAAPLAAITVTVTVPGGLEPERRHGRHPRTDTSGA